SGTSGAWRIDAPTAPLAWSSNVRSSAAAPADRAPPPRCRHRTARRPRPPPCAALRYRCLAHRRSFVLSRLLLQPSPYFFGFALLVLWSGKVVGARQPLVTLPASL